MRSINRQSPKSKTSGQSGIIRFILLILVAVILLSYFGFDLRSIVEDEQTQSNFAFVGEWVGVVWDFIRTPALYVWDFITDVWDRWLSPLLDSIRDTEPSDIIDKTPKLNL